MNFEILSLNKVFRFPQWRSSINSWSARLKLIVEARLTSVATSSSDAS